MTRAIIDAKCDTLDACSQLLALCESVVQRTRDDEQTKKLLDVISALATNVNLATLMSVDSIDAVRALDKLSCLAKTLKDDMLHECCAPAVRERRLQLVAQLKAK